MINMKNLDENVLTHIISKTYLTQTLMNQIFFPDILHKLIYVCCKHNQIVSLAICPCDRARLVETQTAYRSDNFIIYLSGLKLSCCATKSRSG